MLMMNAKEPDQRHPGDPYSIGRARDLNLNRVSLVPLEQVQENRYTFLRPVNTEAYGSDPELRKSTLKARSVLAAAFINGDLEAKYMVVADYEVLLVGQSSNLLSAFGDFASIVTNEILEDGDIKGVVPITEIDSGWRTQFGWIGIFEPEVVDHFAFYSYIRPSIVWFESRPESLQAVVEQRGIQQREQRTVEEIFKAALNK